MPFRGNEDHLHAHPSEIVGHPRDMNALAKQRAESKSFTSSQAFESGWDHYKKHQERKGKRVA